jgi:hypothetical protein
LLPEAASSGKGSIDYSRNYPYLELSSSFSDIKMQNIANLSDKFKNRFFGIAAGNAEIGIKLDKDEDITKSLKGKIEFNVVKGKLVDTGIQNGLGIWLSGLKDKLKDLEFNKIYINSFLFDGSDIRLKLDGFLTKKLEGDIKINLEFNGDFIQDLPNPALIQLSKYKKGDWYHIPFHAKGDDITSGKNIKQVN